MLDLKLDMGTEFVLLVLGHLLTIILFSAYKFRNSKQSVMDVFYAAKWLQAVTWGLFILSENTPGMAVLTAANLFLLLGAASEMVAFLQVTDGFSTKARRFYVYWTAAGMTAYLLVVLLHNTASLRIAVVSFSIAVMLAIPAVRLVSSSLNSSLSQLIGYMYLTIAIVLTARTPLAFFSLGLVDMMNPGVYQTLTFLALYALLMLGNMGFFLLSKERTDRELMRLASYDDLTGALNRRAFMHHTQQTLRQCRRGGIPASFILIDVDHFKTINDSFGHHIGDELLQEFAGKVHPRLREGDLFGRYGGDEFAIFLPGADEQASDEFAENLRAAVLESQRNRGRLDTRPEYTISIGVVTVPAGSDVPLQELFKSSDEALYQAKHAGRNQAARSGA
ncbi:GGDEF domain-containing protein [Paenibacillus sp. 3LSP]|uniref:GGDEF domain-containing protein n=1 Tax=Paenibacillus sp. 3LSP TaxID=2800795 RepID=UPI0028FD3C87|nr:GGDEF domain-containing protein [Paenibacillus sp. 3LSP]MDU0330470.1 GGDEF domain-containing protein [Paenibacillus sp. 3LSP]